MITMIRSIISSVTEGVIKRFTGSGRADESFTNREYFQHYGFTSRPLNGSEGILIKQGNNIILIASDDRRYRLQLKDGEVALYTDEGDYVHLKRGGHIEVLAGTSAKVTSPQVDVVAGIQVKLDTPEVLCTGNLQVSGNLMVTGTAAATGALSSATSVADPTGTMTAMRTTYNSHTHPGDSGGTTGAPNQPM